MVRNLKNKLENNEFVVTMEVEAPKSPNPQGVYEKIKPLIHHLDAINITDNPMAKLRINPIVLGHLIQKNLNIETIFHFTCRDRNTLGIQSELLGANALGVNNILTLTGDDPKVGDHPNAIGVFEVDSTGLVKIAHGLNQGLDAMGNPIEEKTDFLIGGVVNPFAKDLEVELEKLYKKIEAGVRFFQTQPVFDINGLENFLEKVEKIPVPIIYGFMPLKSAKLAKYLNKNVPGITVPKDLVDRLEIGGREAGIEIGKELFKEMKKKTRGIHIFSMGDTDFIQALLKE